MFGVLFLVTASCVAHPHVFIENSLDLIFDADGFAGIRAQWRFDEFFTSMIMADHDKNRNHELEDDEIQAVKKGAFDNLAAFQYFTFIRINGDPFKPAYIREFIAYLKDNRLVYKFLIPCHVTKGDRFKVIRISQYDPSYYSKVTLDKECPISIQGDVETEINWRIAMNKEEAYYYNQIHPMEVILQFKQKNN